MVAAVNGGLLSVEEVCERYGLKYTSGPLHRQIAQTWRTIARLSLPDRLAVAR